MFAVVEIAGMQFEVEPNERIEVPLLDGNAGDVVEFTNVLLAETEEGTKIGTPYIEGKVSARIIEHGKEEKILVFKKKRRKNYRKLRGHRQRFTIIEITEINI